MSLGRLAVLGLAALTIGGAIAIIDDVARTPEVRAIDLGTDDEGRRPENERGVSDVEDHDGDGTTGDDGTGGGNNTGARDGTAGNDGTAGGNNTGGGGGGYATDDAGGGGGYAGSVDGGSGGGSDG